MTETHRSSETASRAASTVDAHRPQFHFLPPKNWMNDPNGLIQWKGKYHLFYQYNPTGAYHANMHWGHAVSTDLVHWEHLPIALAPTPGGADKDGVYSGCAVDHAGIPTLIFTGVSPEVQCIAIANDDLSVFEKRAEPIIAAPPPDLDLFGFRDPCVWREGENWLMALGAGIKDVGGAVLLYRSTDLYQWDYVGPLLTDDTEPRNKVWECPSFFPLGNKYVLIVSVTSRASVDYFIGAFDGRSFRPEVRRELDFGRYFYAPQTFLDQQGRRILIGWVWEGRSEAKDLEAGWSGIQSIPKVLSLLPDNYLGTTPAAELQSLRGAHRRYDDLSLAPDAPFLTDVQSSQLEIEITWQPTREAELGLILAQSPSGEEQTLIVFSPERGELWIDRRHSNSIGDFDLDTQIAPLALNDGEDLKLRVFFDRSVIEIFANDRVCLTSRIYPTRDDSRGVSLFTRRAATQVGSLNIWELATSNQ